MCCSARWRGAPSTSTANWTPPGAGQDWCWTWSQASRKVSHCPPGQVSTSWPARCPGRAPGRGILITTRPELGDLGLSAGKKARLHRILFQHGLRNGTALFLPYDQGLEHGPRDFFANPAATDPRYIIKLARDGGFNGIAVQIGLAEKFYWDYAGEVPLVLKLNGKTDIPPDDAALSPVHATVSDAVRLGADAVGYTLYVGTPAAEQDFAQYARSARTPARLPLISGPTRVLGHPSDRTVQPAGCTAGPRRGG